MCLLAARSAVWQFSDKFPEAKIIVTAVDEMDGVELVPGMGNFEKRFNV